jgi:hypothetical protein
VVELAGWVRRTGASGQLTLRADSGFWSAKVLAACCRHHIRLSITVRRTSTVTAATASPRVLGPTSITQTGAIAQVAHTTLGPDRLIVRRTRLTGPQASLWPDWRYHAFVTDRPGSAIALDAEHRRHAVCELATRDLKDGAGLPCPLPFRELPGSRGLAGHQDPGPQPAALVRHPRAWRQWPGRGQDLAAPPAHPPRSADPLGPPAPAVPADRMAVGRTVSGCTACLQALRNTPDRPAATADGPDGQQAARQLADCPTDPLAPTPGCLASPCTPHPRSHTQLVWTNLRGVRSAELRIVGSWHASSSGSDAARLT